MIAKKIQTSLITIFVSFSFMSNLLIFSDSRICLPFGKTQMSSFFCARQVTNKIDLESKRKIHKKDVKEYIDIQKKQNIMYSETSAITGENVKSTYQLIVNFCKKPVREIWNSRDTSRTQKSKCSIV